MPEPGAEITSRSAYPYPDIGPDAPPPSPPRPLPPWGLASLLLAGFLSVTGLVHAVFGLLYNAHDIHHRQGRMERLLTVGFDALLTLLFLSLSITAIVFAAFGLRAASARGESAPLALTGLLLAAVVAFLWLALLVGWVFTAADAL